MGAIVHSLQGEAQFGERSYTYGLYGWRVHVHVNSWTCRAARTQFTLFFGTLDSLCFSPTPVMVAFLVGSSKLGKIWLRKGLSSLNQLPLNGRRLPFFSQFFIKPFVECGDGETMVILFPTNATSFDSMLPTLSLNGGIFCIILSLLHNNVMDLNNVMNMALHYSCICFGSPFCCTCSVPKVIHTVGS